MPRVTVAIAAHNAARFIGETLDSISGQSYRDFEVIVVDDGSTDRTAEVASSSPNTRVLRRQRGGPAAARNDAIRKGSGEFVAVIDADDLWYPEKLERQVTLLDRRQEVLLVGTLAEAMGGPPVPLPPLPEGRVTRELIELDFLTTSSVMFRRSAFDESGGFDPDPALVAVEDYDLWLRLSLLGPFAGLREVLVRRRLHDSNLSADNLELNRRALRVIEKFERLPESGPYARAVARRKAELCYLIGRALLSRGERIEGRRALRRSRSFAPGHAGPCLALEALSLLPRSWLLGLHELRERRRRAAAHAARGPSSAR